jgi:ribosomal protein S18 acetylase RimI-like enzyme
MLIRDAEERDAAAMAQVLVTSYRQAHADQLPPDYLLSSLKYEDSARNWARTLRRAHPSAAREAVLVAELDGQLVGVAMGGPVRTSLAEPDQDPDTIADLHVLYIHPDHQQRGIGRRLIRAVAQRLAVLGYRAFQVRVLRANHPARGFYEAMGGRFIGEVQEVDDGFVLDLAVYGWVQLADVGNDRGAPGMSAARS